MSKFNDAYLKARLNELCGGERIIQEQRTMVEPFNDDEEIVDRSFRDENGNAHFGDVNAFARLQELKVMQQPIEQENFESEMVFAVNTSVEPELCM